MSLRQIDLQIKIASLAEESRIIRRKERAMKSEAQVLRWKAWAKEKGIVVVPGNMPEDLKQECARRSKPNFERQIKAGKPFCAIDCMANTARKAIRKWLKSGFSKEQILAMPGVQRSLRYTAKLDNLHFHRTYIVRNESRASQLAYAFLRGRTYAKTEDKAKSRPNWYNVYKIAERFSEEDKRAVAQRFEQWKQEANAVIGLRAKAATIH